jgi:hypothetical protein
LPRYGAKYLEIKPNQQFIWRLFAKYLLKARGHSPFTAGTDGKLATQGNRYSPEAST